MRKLSEEQIQRTSMLYLRQASGGWSREVAGKASEILAELEAEEPKPAASEALTSSACSWPRSDERNWAEERLEKAEKDLKDAIDEVELLRNKLDACDGIEDRLEKAEKERDELRKEIDEIDGLLSGLTPADKRYMADAMRAFCAVADCKNRELKRANELARRCDAMSDARIEAEDLAGISESQLREIDDAIGLFSVDDYDHDQRMSRICSLVK